MQKRKEFFKHFAYLKESKLQVQFSLATLLCVHLSSFQQSNPPLAKALL